MTDKKAPNYSEEMTTRIVEHYSACTSDEERSIALQTLSEETGKAVKSLRMKLVREGVYKKPAYVSKAGKTTETKSDIVSAIAEILDVADAALGGLDKATKAALELIRTELLMAVTLRPILDAPTDAATDDSSGAD